MAAPHPATAQESNVLYAELSRSMAIMHRILAANGSLCAKTREDYGFITMGASRASDTMGKTDKKQRKAWIAAFGLDDEGRPTVTNVIPGSAADKAGMLAGDIIVAINGKPFSRYKSPDAFGKSLNAARQSQALSLGVLRDGGEKTLNLVGEKMCDYGVTLVNTDETEAFSNSNQIVVDAALAKLLKRDDVLAFVISHELAHILLGHTLPQRSKEVLDHKMRLVMEKDADALGIRMMVRAGYRSEGAAEALKLMDRANRGSVARSLGLFGAYMLTDKRIGYLNEIIR